MSPLFRLLPGEVRNRIYGFVFQVDYIEAEICDPHDDKRFTTWASNGCCKVRVPFQDLIRLTSTCRQFHAEAASFSYAVNTFKVSLCHLQTFVEVLPEAVRMTITKLIIRDVFPACYGSIPKWVEWDEHLPQLVLLKDLSLLKEIGQGYSENWCGRKTLSPDEISKLNSVLAKFVGRDFEIAKAD